MMRPPAAVRAPDESTRTRRLAAVQRAMTLCEGADRLARDAEAPVENHHLLALLEQRDDVLQDLAEQLAVLQSVRPTADGALFADTQRLVDEADALVADVLAAVTRVHASTVTLATRVAARVDALRDELDALQRTSMAGVAYAAPVERLVDRRR